MSFKKLFVKSDNDDEKVEPKKNANKFPVTEDVPQVTSTFFPTSTPNTPTASFSQVDNDHLNKFVEMYQDGFDSLNQQGYDFYEFFQAIINSGGIDNPQMYVMAMSMGTAMDKSNTKTKLISQADFYINEINKVYNQYVTTGTSKKQELISQKDSENHNLTSELSNLKAQLEAITNQIRTKENQLSLIDNKYQPLIAEVDAKLRANDVAKNTIVNNITKIKDGINNNIK